MATVTKDFRVKSGLVVEGTTGTINGSNILTEASTTFLENYVKDAAGGLLANATLTNIQVDYNSTTNELSLTAENGVADSTTDDLDEGSINLYFTVDRAQDAAAALFEGNHNGIEFSYDDVAGTITATVTGASVPTFSTGIVFEGTAPDNFETTLSVSEPTQDNTIILKDASGTIAFESDVATAKQEAIDYADALTTADIAEDPSALYFTEQRAIDAVGGSATSLNNPNTVVKRDANGDFAAGTISADLTGDVTGTVSSLSNHTTDNLTEGSTNKYFSDSLSRNAVSAGDGLDYNSTTGVFSADLGNGLQFDVNGQIEIDPSVVATDTDVATAISTHSALTTGVHGVTGNVVGTDDVQTLENKTLSTGTVLADNIDADGFTIINLATPTNGTDAATKQYVDGISAGLTWKKAVNLLANSNVNMTGTTGTLVIDGHAALDSADIGYRLLLINQDIATENGIYEYTESAGVYTLVRSSDADTDAELHGASVFVTEGTIYGSTSWVQVNHYVIGFADQEWDQFSGAGTYLAGNGLTLTGNEFSIDTTITATKSYVDGEIDTHEALTSTHGVSGDLVGTSDQQTLSNKVLGTNIDLGADLDAVNTYKVVNLAIPTNSADAATKGYVDGEISTVNSAIDNLNTDDIAELAGATNLYFTDARAVSALEAVTPNFVEIDVNSIAKQIAATSFVATAGQAVGYAFAKADYRSAEFLVKVAYGTHTEVSKVILTLDTADNIAITEYAVVGTNGSASTISAGINGGNVELLVTTTNNSSTIAVSGTLLV